MGRNGPARDEFAALALRIVREMAPDRAVDHDADEFALRIADGDARPTVIYLENVFRESDGGDPDGAIRRLAAPMLVRDTPSWPEARPRLRPVLRPTGFGRNTDSPLEALRRPGMPYLDEMVVVDEPTAMSYVTTARAEEWGVSADEVFAAARENLAGLVRPPGNGTAGSLVSFVDPSGDSYHTSWPLDRGWRTGLAARPVLFMAEHHSLLLVHAGSGSLAGVFKLVEDEYAEAVRPLSPVGYTVAADGALVPYEVDPDHPDAPAVARAATLLAADAYARQGAWLRKEHEITMEPAYIANLLVGENEAGRRFTVASWADRITTWMPRADYVALGPDRSLVPWAVVEAEVGLTAVSGVEPARYEVGDWPAAEVLDRLLARAEPP